MQVTFQELITTTTCSGHINHMENFLHNDDRILTTFGNRCKYFEAAEGMLNEFKDDRHPQ